MSIREILTRKGYFPSYLVCCQEKHSRPAVGWGAILDHDHLASRGNNNSIQTQSGPFQLLDLIQHLDDIGCHQSTKYLAKTYLDLYLSRQTEVISDNLHLMAITASRLAFKVECYLLSSMKANSILSALRRRLRASVTCHRSSFAWRTKFSPFWTST